MKRAGLFNEVIDIYKVIYSTNEFGEQVQEYIKCYTTRARVTHDNGNRTLDNGEIFYNYNKSFIVRSYVPLDERHIIEYDGKRYRILTIENRVREWNDKIIECELINE